MGGLDDGPQAHIVPVSYTHLDVYKRQGLTIALKEGDSFPATLTFQSAGDVTINVEVLSLRAEGPDCAHAGQ